MKKILKKIKENYKIALTLIFSLLVFIYNQNSQTLNFVLKRGIILEYSIDKNAQDNIEAIKDKLDNLNIKYYALNDVEKKRAEYAAEFEPVERTLLVGLPYKANQDKKALFDDISDFVFEKYPNSKLIDVKTLNDSYYTPWSAMAKFFDLLLLTCAIWLIFLLIFYDKKELREDTINSFIKLKKSTATFFDKIKTYLNTAKNWLFDMFQSFRKRGLFGFLADCTKKIISGFKADIKELREDSKKDFTNFFKTLKEEGILGLIKSSFKKEEVQEKENFTGELISTIVFVVVCLIVIRYFIGELRLIPSASMHPVILEHDRVFVEKLNYPTKKEIKRGDMLVFYPPEVELSYSPVALLSRLSGILCKDIAYIKRTIGLPGEKFEIKYDENSSEYRVFINDKPLNEPYISSKNIWTECSRGLYCGPFEIPEKNYFMMGDNRNNSQDSRFWGFLEEDRIIGRANFMFWPFSRVNLLRDKHIVLHRKKTKDGYESYDYIVNRYEFFYKI